MVTSVLARSENALDSGALNGSRHHQVGTSDSSLLQDIHSKNVYEASNGALRRDLVAFSADDYRATVGATWLRYG